MYSTMLSQVRCPRGSLCCWLQFALHQFGPLPKLEPICIISAQFWPIYSLNLIPSGSDLHHFDMIFGSNLHQFAQQNQYQLGRLSPSSSSLEFKVWCHTYVRLGWFREAFQKGLHQVKEVNRHRSSQDTVTKTNGDPDICTWAKSTQLMSDNQIIVYKGEGRFWEDMFMEYLKAPNCNSYIILI